MKETILILGADGYLGWNLMMYLGVRNDGEVIGVDNGSRRRLVREVGSDSLTDIKNGNIRLDAYKEVINPRFENGRKAVLEGILK